jgi:hypothetical protein
MAVRSRVDGARVRRTGCHVALLIDCGLAAGAGASERKAYKYVDEKGNVVYSQTPPAQGKDAKTIDISPAHSSRGGYATRERPVPDRSGHYDRREEMRLEQERRRQEEAKRRADAQQERVARSIAECERNRGTDCSNPDTLRYQQSTSIPRPYQPRVK